MPSQNTPSDSTTGPVGPRRIPPREKADTAAPTARRPHRGRWIATAVLAALVIAGAVAFALIRSTGAADEGESDDAQIRTSIDAFTAALRDGDLGTLRAVTCGPLGSFYAGISDTDFAAVHDAAVAANTIPLVDSIDTIAVTEAAEGAPDATATAIAQVTARTDPAGPASARTFDLAHEGTDWKVCA